MTGGIREATAADEPALRALLGELGYPVAGDVGARLARWTGVPERSLLVAAEGDDVVGLVAVTTTPRLESDTWWAQVVALVVAARARGRGVGRSLLRAAEELAARAGCDAVVVNSARSRTSAQAFYPRAGYRDRCADHAQFVRRLPGA